MFHDTPNPNALETKLIHTGALNLDDLPFNQAGELSPRQRRWLVVEVAAWGVQVAIDLVFIVTIWVFFFRFHLQNDSHAPWLLTASFWSILLAIATVWCVDHARAPSFASKNNDVNAVAGTLQKRYVSYGAGRNAGSAYTLTVRGRTFAVPRNTYALIIDHHTYKLFYIPSINRLLNIEPLFSADEQQQSHLSTLQNRARETKE